MNMSQLVNTFSPFFFIKYIKNYSQTIISNVLTSGFLSLGLLVALQTAPPQINSLLLFIMSEMYQLILLEFSLKYLSVFLKVLAFSAGIEFLKKISVHIFICVY